MRRLFSGTGGLSGAGTMAAPDGVGVRGYAGTSEVGCVLRPVDDSPSSGLSVVYLGVDGARLCADGNTEKF